MARSRNRKERRKESKRIEEVISDDSNMMDKFFIAAAVILVLLCFYILTVHITNKNKNNDEEEKEKTVEISKDKIVVGRSLSMGKNDYYVIFYDYVYENSLEEMASNYKGELPIYKVNMSLGFNRKYATLEESNKNPTKASEFKINGPTLIKVSNKKVVEYVEGEDNIRTILN
jgi:hypothetical protein